MSEAHVQWRKSSHSGSETNCVEVAFLGDTIATRDSKNRSGPVLVFNRGEWAAFLAGVREGEFGTPSS